MYIKYRDLCLGRGLCRDVGGDFTRLQTVNMIYNLNGLIIERESPLWTGI